ncbi:hypothetical protein HW452_16670 [Halomonas aquamarina]|uniref:Uncharacterized protein n=1 Tax=Vreelandella aquamarina TaxID=77097 RepID=A0ACC5VY24_9GAMM|nr:hypothetical protein [Halomonas aquamarina]MBZ5489155.1 hypothetical protein [Halomonas aquamarina]
MSIKSISIRKDFADVSSSVGEPVEEVVTRLSVVGFVELGQPFGEIQLSVEIDEYREMTVGQAEALIAEELKSQVKALADRVGVI